MKVRIALAIDPEGDWACAGWGGMSSTPTDKDKMDVCIDQLGSGEMRYWIEVDIPVPEVQVLSATAEPAQEQS